MRVYRVIGYSCDPMHFSDNDDVWESIDHPRVHWLKRQEESRFSLKIESGYKNRGTQTFYTEVYVVFLDQRLETEFLLKFGEDVSATPCSA